MLQNAYLLAKIGADTAENERNFAEFFQKLQLPYLRSGVCPRIDPAGSGAAGAKAGAGLSIRVDSRIEHGVLIRQIG